MTHAVPLAYTRKLLAYASLMYLSTSNEAVFAFRAKKPLHNEARPRKRSDRGRFLHFGKKASSYRGAYRVPLFNLSVCA